MSGKTGIPTPSTPFLDSTGNVALIWRQFLVAILNRTGGPTASANALLNGNSNQQFAVQTADQPTSAVPLAQYRSQPGQAPSAISVGASPWTFQATSNGFLVIDGGTVSNVEYQRAGVQAQIGSGPELIPMRANDLVVVTYSAAPSAVWFPN